MTSSAQIDSHAIVISNIYMSSMSFTSRGQNKQLFLLWRKSKQMGRPAGAGSYHSALTVGVGNQSPH